MEWNILRNILPSRWKCFKCLSSIRTILQTNKTPSEPRFDASNNKRCTSMCVSVYDVNMNVVTDPEARYYLRPVVYSSGQRAATVENTRLRSSPYCCCLSSSRWRNGLFSSTGRHSLYFQSAHPRCKMTDGIQSFLKRPRNSHRTFGLTTLNTCPWMSSQTGKHSLFFAGNISVT